MRGAPRLRSTTPASRQATCARPLADACPSLLESNVEAQGSTAPVTLARVRYVAALIGAAVIGLLTAGCGGGGNTSQRSPATLSNQHHETATEAGWRQHAEQFSHELETGLQALASTAHTDAYQAVSNLGPLTYCSQNLAALGSPPPVYQLAYGSLTAACGQLERGARMWRAAANDTGGDFDTASLVVSAGDRLLVRGEERLGQYATRQPPLSGQEAARVQRWAGEMELYGENGTLRSYDFGPPHGLRVALQKIGSSPSATYQDVGNGYQQEFENLMDCSEVLGLPTLTPPPEPVAQNLWTDFNAACQSLQRAIHLDQTQPDTYGQTYDIGLTYASGRKQLLRAIAELDELAP